MVGGTIPDQGTRVAGAEEHDFAEQATNVVSHAVELVEQIPVLREVPAQAQGLTLDEKQAVVVDDDDIQLIASPQTDLPGREPEKYPLTR
jgi:hypothetical protein